MPRPNNESGAGPDGARLGTSAYLLRHLSVPGIWRLARRTTANARSIYGRVDFRVKEITSEGLALDANFNPFRHVDIVGWSAQEDKDRNMAFAQALAQRARPRRLKNPILATGELAD